MHISFLKDLKNTRIHLLVHGKACYLLPLAAIGEDFPAPASLSYIPYYQKDRLNLLNRIRSKKSHPNVYKLYYIVY